MDRLHALRLALAVVALVSLPACGDDSSSTAEAPPSRTVGVAADPDDTPSVEDLCEVHPAAADRPELVMPEMATAGPAMGSSTRWINVWATWCRPCVEEMPMLLLWKQRLASEGVDVDLVFVSADESDEVVATFREEHPGIPEGARIAEVAALRPWVTTVGLDEGATLPIHVFVGPDDRVRCARTGAIAENEYSAVKQLLGGS